MTADAASVFPPVPDLAERVLESPPAKAVTELPAGAIARLELLLRDPDGFLTGLDGAEAARAAAEAEAHAAPAAASSLAEGGGDGVMVDDDVLVMDAPPRHAAPAPEDERDAKRHKTA